MKKTHVLKVQLKNFNRSISIIVLFISFNLLSTSSVMAQKTISGKVTSTEDNAPIPGVSVSEKGTTNGVITDMDGKYALKVQSEKAILLFSFVGYSTQEIAVGSNETINIQLQAKDYGLDEVVVVGYGSIKKSDLTGSVSTIKSESIDKIGSTTVSEALQGQAAGVTVTKFGGAPGSGSMIRIRGVGTIGNNEPLYIIDGIQGNFNLLNPADIESIEILKDGAAAAIYGSRAANGVIIVTTKTGKKGAAKVDLDMFTGIVNPTNQLDMANSSEYLKVMTMMYENAGEAVPSWITDTYSYDTDWQEAVRNKNALKQNYNLRISAANDVLDYSLSGLFADEKGTYIGNNFKKASLRANAGITKKRFKLKANVSYAETANDPIKFQIRENVYQILPIIPVYDASKEYGFGMPDAGSNIPSNNNPVGVDHFETELNTTQHISLTINGEFNIFKGLDYKFNLGHENSNLYTNTHAPTYIVNEKEPNLYPVVTENRSNWQRQIMEHWLTYDKTIADHSISLLAGYTATSQKNKWIFAKVEGYTTLDDGTIVASGFLDQSFNTLNAGVGGTYSASGSEYIYNRLSYLGRFNYSYKNRYLLQGTFRRDGSSKFGPGKRYGNFPSIAAGWKIHQESFMQSISAVNQLKLRASWGILGNEVTLGYYDWMPLIESANDYTLGYVQGTGLNHWPGSISRKLENLDLRWEETETINIGLDFGLWDSQLSGTVNYYQKTTNDMLVIKSVPPSAGIDDPVLNLGDIRNNGLELELTYRNRKNKFNYEITGNLSSIKNEVLRLAQKDDQINGEGLKYGDSHFPTSTRVGTEIGAFYLYETDGIFQTDEEAANYVNSDGDRLLPNATAGDLKFLDTNNDGIIDPDDKTYQGSGIPKIEYSLSLNADYLGFDFSMMLYGVAGNKIYNGNMYYFQGFEGSYNVLSSSVNAWTPQNTNTDIPRAVNNDPNSNSRESTRFLESGSFLKLRLVQLGYTLPQSILDKVKIDRCRIYISGENLFTFTKYSGIDPEVGRNSPLNIGVDRAFYPMVKTVLFGLQLSF